MLIGGAGNDTFTEPYGEDGINVFNGGGGFNVAIFNYHRADYTITTNSSDVVVTNNITGGQFTLISIEQIQFSDQTINLAPVIPVVSSLAAVTDTQTPNVSTGHLVTITMTTSDAVTVTGVPTLQLNDHEVAAYSSGSGTNTLTFAYTVQPSDITADLQVTGLNLPSGAAIQDQAGALSGSVTGNLGIQVNNVVNNSITDLYIGYYNRAPDTVGETYWAGQLQGGMSLSAIAQSYSVQTESTTLYPFLASPNTASTAAVQAFVTAVYENLFDRAPDTAGENYWVTQLQTGASTVGGAIINIISGAQLNDLVTINNKVVVGNYFDTQIFTHNVQFSDSVALAALNAVTSSASSVTTAEALVNTYVATAPHAAQAAASSQSEVGLVGISPSHDLAIAA